MKIELRIRGLPVVWFHMYPLCPLTCVWYLVPLVVFAGRSRGTPWLAPLLCRPHLVLQMLSSFLRPHMGSLASSVTCRRRVVRILLTRKSHPIQCSGCGVNRTKKTHTERSVASRFFVLPSCGETNRVAGLGSWWRPPVSELTCCVHIIFLKENSRECFSNVFQAKLGSPQVVQPEMYGTLRRRFCCFCSLLMSNKVVRRLELFSRCEERSCVRESLSSSFLALQEPSVVLARGVFADIFLELPVLLLLLLVVTLLPHVGRSVELSSI